MPVSSMKANASSVDCQCCWKLAAILSQPGSSGTVCAILTRVLPSCFVECDSDQAGLVFVARMPQKADLFVLFHFAVFAARIEIAVPPQIDTPARTRFHCSEVAEPVAHGGGIREGMIGLFGRGFYQFFSSYGASFSLLWDWGQIKLYGLFEHQINLLEYCFFMNDPMVPIMSLISFLPCSFER